MSHEPQRGRPSRTRAVAHRGAGPALAAAGADGRRPAARCCSAFRARHPARRDRHDRPGLRGGGRAPIEGQLRNSGEAYISHPLAVATILAGLGLDDVTIAAALLHDAVEDTALRPGRDRGRVRSRRGGHRRRRHQAGAGPLRLPPGRSRRRPCARCSSPWPRTPGSCSSSWPTGCTTCRPSRPCPSGSRSARAQETLDIYAPLAHRFGIQDIKWQLEDLAFAALHPRRYAEIEQMVATRAPERDIYLAQVIDQVNERLVAARIEAQVTGRPKHLYSIYEKMVVKGKEFDEIYDLVGVRVLVDSVKDCWAALGAIHGAWTPVQGRFKDYINTPKFNLYQSLHTTVVGPQGKPLEVADPHRRDAQPGRVGHRRPLGLQGEGLRGRRRLAAAHRRLVGGEHRPGRVPREP